VNEKIIIIQGKPIGKARPRFSRVGSFVKVYSPQAKIEKKISEEIRLQWKSKPIDCPVIIEATFLCPITKGSKKTVADMLNGTTKNVKKPDIDNYGKWALDCMNGIVFLDDRQVYELALNKGFAQEPQTIIRVTW
jgi:Holliday junction resolvase RusA-like endonuclease